MVGFKWIKAHAGHKWNERADMLAALGRKKHLATQAPTANPKASIRSMDGVDWRQW
jgi:ribonuclease HI